MNGIGFSRREFIGGVAAFSVAGGKTGEWLDETPRLRFGVVSETVWLFSGRAGLAQPETKVSRKSVEATPCSSGSSMCCVLLFVTIWIHPTGGLTK